MRPERHPLLRLNLVKFGVSFDEHSDSRVLNYIPLVWHMSGGLVGEFVNNLMVRVFVKSVQILIAVLPAWQRPRARSIRACWVEDMILG